MGQARDRAKDRDERVAAAKAKHFAAEQKVKLFFAEVGLARLKYALNFGMIGGTDQRIVVIDFDELVTLLDKIWPEEVELPADTPLELTDEDLKAYDLPPVGATFKTEEESKAMAERFKFALDMKRARAKVAAAIRAQEKDE